MQISEEELLGTLVATISQLGWSVALPDIDDEATVPGMIIGTENYIDAVLKHLPEDLFK